MVNLGTDPTLPMTDLPDRSRIPDRSRAHPAVQADRPLRPGELLPALVLALGVIASLAYATLKPRHVAGETLGVVSIGGPPQAAIAAIAAAGGQVLRDGSFAGGVIARAPDAGFVDRLYIAGADVVYRIDGNINCAAVLPAEAGRTQPSGAAAARRVSIAGWTASGDG
jgi:hypothetical protein